MHSCCTFLIDDWGEGTQFVLHAIALAILLSGSARAPHVLRVRSGRCALASNKLAAPITRLPFSGRRIILLCGGIAMAIFHAIVNLIGLLPN